MADGEEFAIGVKGFMVNEKQQLLVLRRESEDKHLSGIWELPGGRLRAGEDPFEGLKREVQEETGLNIDIKMPLTVRHFTREDGQKITMIVFVCLPLGEDLVLSEEHSASAWIDINSDKELQSYFTDGYYMKEVSAYRELFVKN